MKKALSFILVLAMVLTSFSFAFAASYPDVEDTNFEDAVEVLSELGIVSGYPDGTYKPANIVTRAEMAKLIITALGLDEYVAGSYSAFKDVPGSHWATSFIAYADSMGIIKGYPDGTFKPDQTVTYQEAVTMVVRALGYQDQYLTGVWPASHVSAALSLNLLDGLKATAEGANRGDVAKLLYNALDKAIITYDTNGNTVLVGANMLTRNDCTDGMRQIMLPEDEDDVDLSKYYGYSVIPYTDDNNDDKLIAVGDVKGTAYVMEIKTTTPAITAEYNDKTYTLNMLPNPADANDIFIINGTTENNANNLALDDATIIVDGSIKTAGTNVYSIVQWNITDAVKAGKSDVTAIADADDEVFGYDFDVNDDDEYEVVLEGVDAMSDIQKDDIVYIYLDTNNLVKKIAVANNVITAKVDKIKTGTTPTKYKLTLNGTEYKFNSHYIADEVAANAFVVGDEYDFYLGPDGKIAYAEATEGSMGDFAIIINAGDVGSGMDANKGIKVMSNTGVVSTLTLKDNVDLSINGAAAVSTAKAAVVANAAITSGAIVKYSTDKNNKVKAIDTYATAATGAAKMSSKYVLNNKKASDKTVVFTFDGVVGTFTTAAGDYDVANIKSYADADFPATSLWVDKDNDGDIDVLIVNANVAGSDDDVFDVVNSWRYVKNADDDDVVELTLVKNGVFLAEDDTATYRISSNTTGAVIYGFERDSNNEITNAQALVYFAGDVDAAGNPNAPFKAKLMIAGWELVDSFSDSNNLLTTTSAGVKLIYNVADDAVVYVLQFNDGATDGYKLGSLSNVADGAYVMLADTTDNDKDEANIVLVVKRADYKDYGAAPGGSNILGF